jgi:hypothetical protein
MKLKYVFLALFFYIFNISTNKAQIPNSGFENWQVDGNNDNNPVGWSTTNSDPEQSVSPYTPAYAGSFSMKVETFNPGIMIVPGVAEITFAFNQRPSVFNICLKTNIAAGDKVYIIVSLFNGDSIVASPDSCSFVIDSTISDFTCFSYPIVYQSPLNPDSANILIVAGSMAAQVGTEIIVDELSFGGTSGLCQIDEITDRSLKNYPNPAGDYTHIPFVLENDSDIELSVWDASGSLVKSYSYRSLKAGKQDLLVNTSMYSNGIYSYSIKGKEILFHGKLIVSKKY